MYVSDEDQDGGYRTYISEERYRAMLGEHVNKHKRKHNNSNNNLSSSANTYNGVPEKKSSLGSKDRKHAHKVETASNFLSQKPGSYEVDISQSFNMNRFVNHLDLMSSICYLKVLYLSFLS